MPQQTKGGQRILVFVDEDELANDVSQIGLRYGYSFFRCVSIAQVCAEINLDGSALVISKKALSDNGVISDLTNCLERNFSWSHLPIMVLLKPGDEIPEADGSLVKLERVASLTLIETPLKAGAFLRLIKLSLAYRERQFRARDLMHDLVNSRREAVEADRAKSDFLANISHEIRTPLGAILGFAELLMDGRTSRREKKDYMIAARRNGQMLSALIDDILDLSRVEAGTLEISKIDFSLSELLAEIVSTLGPIASKKNLPLIVQRPKGLDQIVADPIRVKQVLLNIIGNAIKFTSHGSVHVRFEIGSSENGLSDLRIEVEDTGIGISGGQAAQLFRPFTQADSSVTRKFGGTGLGLVLSQKLLRAMGGDLRLKWSIPGGGSCFEIMFPIRVIASKKNESSATQTPNRLPLAGARVLLVDDSLDNQMLISSILKLLGAEVETANDGVEAIEKALGQTFDVVLMDLQMPRLGGVEATRMLRARGYQKPIVALTAHSLHEDRERCLNVGCTDYLTKPVQRSLLVQVIERVARGTSADQRPARAH